MVDPLRYLPFLRDFGTHFTINRMLSFDSVRQRLDASSRLRCWSLTTWCSRPSTSLNCRAVTRLFCRWAARTNGVTSSTASARRRIDQRRALRSDDAAARLRWGAKMGKTAIGAVWLNVEQLSSYEFWQFWRNTEDDDVARFLRLFTELPLEEASVSAS